MIAFCLHGCLPGEADLLFKHYEILEEIAIYYTWLLKLAEDVESGLDEFPCNTRSMSRQCCRGPGSGVYVNVSPVEYIIPSLLTNDTGTCRNK